MSGQVPGDAAERRVARDPSRSVIVQAPAGSGKTELLMQRYLALLACVDEPEEILAVTFTRKAAAEMRERILRALSPPPSGATDERLPETAELADAALARGESRGWQLLEFPGRLRIRTLDSVNSWLVESAPLAGTGAADGRVTEHSEDLYRQARAAHPRTRYRIVGACRIRRAGACASGQPGGSLRASACPDARTARPVAAPDRFGCHRHRGP